MAESTPAAAEPPVVLEQGTYEILRQRLATHGAELEARLTQLNAARQEVFGSIPTTLLATERITTSNNCVPRDMFPIGGGRFLFGYNVQFGLRTEIQLEDVFAIYEHRGHEFVEQPLDALRNGDFEADFKSLYKYYKNTVLKRFARIGPHLFMVFRVGKSLSDIKTFKWLCEDGHFTYQGTRSDHEYRYPEQHEFTWKRTHRELHRFGLHPHISIEDRLFVECVGGDLTVKIEDNTATGQGIYAEPVDHRDQTLDDAEVYYAILDNLILLRVRPYQEKHFRHFVFNEKQREVRRIDALGEACVLLPGDHGIIFPRGYYLQSGEFKVFDNLPGELRFDRRILSPNGEDFLFAFHNRESGEYVLLSYNLIARQVESPLICSGFTLFDNGEMAVLRADPAPQKHHVVQIWQTPYVSANWQPPVKKESYLFKVGNATLVRAMAECRQVLALIGKDDTYANLYVDLVKLTTDLADSYFWLDRPEVFNLRGALDEIRRAGEQALAEFEKVVQIRRATAAEVARVTGSAETALRKLDPAQFKTVNEFVQALAEFRRIRGELIALRELRYVDLGRVNAFEERVSATSDELARQTVSFLARPEALDPYRQQVEALPPAVEAIQKVAEGKQLDEQIVAAGRELELLIEIVSNLRIEDATETTRIIDGISQIYARLNQVRAALRNRIKSLRSTEAVAEFAAQTRLLEQALANYLDLCTAPEKCDELLTRLLVQVEELEARFADFDEFVVQLSEQRTAFAQAFEARKLDLVESRSRRAAGLLAAAERILKGVQHRAGQFANAGEIHAYFAADLMVAKVRDLTEQLLELGDTTKADDLQGRLKTIREEALRQLKDRQELFSEGPNLIQLGRHKFRVTTQEPELTLLRRGDDLSLHLTGTNFHEIVDDPALLEARDLWSHDLVSETPEIYRGEFLAWAFFCDLEQRHETAAAAGWSDGELAARLQTFMSPRYREGYVKGVHDHDAARIVRALLEVHAHVGLLRHPPDARVCAALWQAWRADDPAGQRLLNQLRGHAAMSRAFGRSELPAGYLSALTGLLAEFAGEHSFLTAGLADEAGEFIYRHIAAGGEPPVSPEAHAAFEAFEAHLHAQRLTTAFTEARAGLEGDPATAFAVVRDWVGGFLTTLSEPPAAEYLNEIAWLAWRGSHLPGRGEPVTVTRTLTGLLGQHPRLQDGSLAFHYREFRKRLHAHLTQQMPRLTAFHDAKQSFLARRRQELRLDELKPQVLTSFVRNQLIDTVYLPFIGDNLAKQIGTAGDDKRTDRSGLLLLVSPPGYGKTTLMEYLASRLGLVFVKINGPAIGHQVTSVDPADAANSAARQELERLNFAFEVGDTVMIYLDDIQHLNPEFLQKFISLCDSQRKIEGIYRGRSRTYDFRGRKVAVVMAGNPYTESGEKFRIPDMLANRADTHNLGDIVGSARAAFELSYLENAAGANPVLARFAGRSHKDLLALIKLGEGGPRDGVEFEGSYSPEELNEAVSVVRKLLRVRDVVLRVNEEYVRSATMQDAYRTEPPFKLQGSYRNMARIAGKVLAVMNDGELEELLQQHYRSESQTLTRDAEANLLKLRELTNALTPEESARWEDIKKTFRKNLLLGGGDEQDPVTRVVQQLSAFYSGLDSIKDTLAAGAEPTMSPRL